MITSLLCSARRSLGTRWKSNYIFGFSLDVGIRGAPNSVLFFKKFPVSYVSVTNHRLDGWSRKIRKGQKLFEVCGRTKTRAGMTDGQKLLSRHRKVYTA